ncbi:MAG TPA: hypothetical protein VFZ21_20135 [Gemmatimonadaceae bacterium]|jgi:isoleucyl-tRNA synthetase|nr:hypothetical protein [Gemmatimonadaceae bacterium]
MSTVQRGVSSVVLRCTKDREEYVTRQARWVDFGNDYETLDLEYVERGMWAFTLRRLRVVPYERARFTIAATRSSGDLVTS